MNPKPVVSYLVSERNFKSTDTPIVIGFTGHIGSGKTFVMNQILSQLVDEGYSVRCDSLAAPIKHAIQYFYYKTKNGLETYEDDFVFASKPSVDRLFRGYEEVLDYIHSLGLDQNLSWRKLAQTIGESCRKAFHPDIWVEMLLSRIDYANVDFVLINDVRYPNEEERLRKAYQDHFLLIKVDRPREKILESLGLTEFEYEEMLKHESELAIEDLKPDLTIQNI